jgi:hypothetical protein
MRGPLGPHTRGILALRRHLALISAALLAPSPAVAQTSLRNPAPPTPWIASGTCPGEGCTFDEAWTACTTVVARKEKRPDASPAFILHRGDQVRVVTGDVHVDVPGMVVFRDTLTYVPEPGVPSSHDTVRFARTDTLYLLNYLGEGSLVWWLHGRADTGQVFWWTWPEPNPDPEDRAVLVRRTRAPWWVRVRNDAGAEGWLVPGFSIGARYDIGLEDNCPEH